KLQNSSKYKVITSLAWQQPLTSKADAKLLHIFAGQAYDANGNPLSNPSVTPPQDDSSTAAPNGQTPAKWQLNGTVKVWLDTYVVIDSDFLLTENVPVMNSDAGDTSSHNQLMSFALNETVRARSNEINYMDNPIYGVLVLVNPAQ
ncbi:MAG: peptidoglycan binding protein CsiV, partial [Gammaproteobacteria bacterium]|nr:peptidoglycan binding protein CsiV [Gammaproteobacteria bacterium]